MKYHGTRVAAIFGAFTTGLLLGSFFPLSVWLAIPTGIITLYYAWEGWTESEWDNL